MQTCRRKILSDCLRSEISRMRGHVLDVGGEREGMRGDFCAPKDQVSSWKYLNIDVSTRPDYCCSAEVIPVEDAVFDTVLLCEVLEHLENPEKVLSEIFRVLKEDGRLIVTIPFLFPVHADPYDFQRWTAYKLEKVLHAHGFQDVHLRPMGSVFSVIFDLFFVTVNSISSKKVFLRRFCFLGLRLTQPVFKWLDALFPKLSNKVTTGYFIIAVK